MSGQPGLTLLLYRTPSSISKGYSADYVKVRMSSWVQVDALDYDARLSAYARLLPGAWAGMAPVQALPLLHAALHDLRNGDDLALRHAASQVLPAVAYCSASLHGHASTSSCI
jgi:hypothetical protein